MIQSLRLAGSRHTLSSGSVPRPGRGMLFVLATAPTEVEVKHLTGRFNLSKLVFKDLYKVPYSRRYSVRPFAFIMHDYYIENNAVAQSNILIMMTDKALLVATSKDSPYYRNLFESTLDKLAEQKPTNIGHLLYHFLLEDVEDNYAVLEHMEQTIVEIESNVAANSSTKDFDVKKIIALKRKIFRMTRQFSASIKILTALRSGSAHVKLDKQSEAYLYDLHETFVHQIDVASSQKDMLSDIIAVNSTNISNRLATASNELNVIMKRLAAVALILMLPTLISGMYGMNFEFLPFSTEPGGFYFITALMVAIIAGTGLLFRKARWL